MIKTMTANQNPSCF